MEFCLTRKQLWRRQTHCIQRLDHDYLYHEVTNKFNQYGGVPQRSASEPSISLLNIYHLGRLWATTGDLSNNLSNNKKIKKKVKFINSVRVILIPTRHEYLNANITDIIWWNDLDYKGFKSSAVREVESLMNISKVSNKTAMRLLYQNQPEGVLNFSNMFSEEKEYLLCTQKALGEVDLMSLKENLHLSCYNSKSTMFDLQTDVELEQNSDYQHHTSYSKPSSRQSSEKESTVHPLALMC